VRFFDKQEAVMSFSIVESGSDDYKYLHQDLGAVLVDFEWKVTKDHENLAPPRPPGERTA
jgi:hypothetical protein